ncbi:hypothetical protein GCM10009118_02190 [Wandonia haliotis]|uniref:Putative beta-lactamase-inhibitor-like PepSY-like domain-containing protein n=1 Tax=Wandonia haliotis TaxID=574963 RepID=A0ABP3XWP4_9FLAO
MKKYMMLLTVTLLLAANSSFAQDIPQNQVPSVIVNNFQKKFPKAYDIEWELDGTLYKVEFETGRISKDHDAWYDKTGALVRLKEEITKEELPQKVLESIKQEFSGYRMDDIKRVTEGSEVYYRVDLESFSEEWKVVYAENGKLISKVAD